MSEFSLGTLIDYFGYPDPENVEVRELYHSEWQG
jgi:hypothetical protein